MLLSTEALIMLGVLGFYIYDSTLLLFSNEIVFIESFGKWRAYTPSDRWRLMSKFLFLPNPLLAFNLIFTTVLFEESIHSDVELNKINKLKTSLSFIRISIILLIILFFIILPLALFKLGIGNATLIVVLSIYLNIISMLSYVFMNRVDLGINNKVFAAIAFEAIACPPLAINLIRRISLHNINGINPIKFAAENLDSESYNDLIEKLIDKLNEKLDFQEDESSPRSLELIKQKEQLLGSVK